MNLFYFANKGLHFLYEAFECPSIRDLCAANLSAVTSIRTSIVGATTISVCV